MGCSLARSRSHSIRTDYIELPGSDLEATKAFFSGLLDWKFVDYGPEYTSFSDGRLGGGFYKSDNTASVASGSALVVIYVADLETTRDRVSSLGGTITKDIFSFPGGRRFHFEDPNGNEMACWSEERS